MTSSLQCLKMTGNWTQNICLKRKSKNDEGVAQFSEIGISIFQILVSQEFGGLFSVQLMQKQKSKGIFETGEEFYLHFDGKNQQEGISSCGYAE